MFKFLQRILGKSSSSYESLMNSRNHENKPSQQSIDKVKEALKPILLNAYELELKKIAPKKTQGVYLLEKDWPINKKGIPLLYMGTVQLKEYSISIFQYEEGLKKDKSNIQIRITPSDQSKLSELVYPESNQYISDTQYITKPIQSLPIWEEIIHRNHQIHRLIVSLAPKNPWTLYKEAKSQLCNHKKSINSYLGGYPQWIVNDIDYRKIKEMNFIANLFFKDENKTIFFFTKSNNLIIRFIQNN